MVLVTQGMSSTPKDPKKIRSRIRSYERKLKKEITDGFSVDGAGKRYLLGPLYLLMNELKGALSSYQWFQENFPDDAGDAAQYLCWALALHRDGQAEAAATKLRQTMLMNGFLLRRLLHEQFAEADPSQRDFHLLLEAQEVPQEFLDIWDEDGRDWARALYKGDIFTKLRNRAQEIEQILEDEPRGSRRSALVHELYGMRE